jgi:hypothetical protein
VTLPANIRINTSLPFPALAKGSGPVIVSKVNGIWTIGLSFGVLGVQSPPPGNFPTDYLLVYDSIANTFFKMPLGALATFGAGRTQRSITSSGQFPIQANDSILNINNLGDLVPIIPLASGRNGAPLTFKNLPSSHTQTLTRTSPDTFDGATTVSLIAGAAVTLVPYNDGVNAGYAIE